MGLLLLGFLLIVGGGLVGTATTGVLSVLGVVCAVIGALVVLGVVLFGVANTR